MSPLSWGFSYKFGITNIRSSKNVADMCTAEVKEDQSKKKNSLKLTYPLKIGGWETILSFWDPAYFQGRWLLVLGRVVPSTI